MLRYMTIGYIHKVKSSERLFRRLFALFPFMIKSFSSRQRLHFRKPALHEGTRFDHFMSYERFARLSFQMYFDNSVSLPWRSFLMDFV